MMSLSQAPYSKNITLHNSTAGSFSDCWGSHSSDYEDWSSLGCNVMLPGRSVWAFQSKLLLPSCVLLFQRNPLTLAPSYLLWWPMKQVCLCTVKTLLTRCMASHPRRQIYAELSLCPTRDWQFSFFCLWATSYITLIMCIYLLHLIDNNNIALFLCFILQ